MGLSLPGTATSGGSGSVNATQYESQFNATAMADSWGGTPFSGIPVIGDIYAGFNFLWQNIKYLLDGFPMFLQYIADTYIADSTAHTSFLVVAYALRAIFAFLICIFLIEFISGRILD